MCRGSLYRVDKLASLLDAADFIRGSDPPRTRLLLGCSRHLGLKVGRCMRANRLPVCCKCWPSRTLHQQRCEYLNDDNLEPLPPQFRRWGHRSSGTFLNHGGAVVSTSIDKYINICVNRRFDDDLRVSYSDTEICKTVDEIQHPLVRECLRLTGVSNGIEIASMADIPATGTGLGSSSSFTVGLLNALYAYQGRQVTRYQLGRDSCNVEIDICKEPIGKQDQYAAAFGGLNFIKFNVDNTVEVESLDFHSHVRDRIKSCILVFYTGITRRASVLLAEQNAAIRSGSKTKKGFYRWPIRPLLRDELRRGNADSIGALMHEGWKLQEISF